MQLTEVFTKVNTIINDVEDGSISAQEGHDRLNRLQTEATEAGLQTSIVVPVDELQQKRTDYINEYETSYESSYESSY